MAARLYESGPSPEELDALGLTLDDVADDSDVEVWPENWPVLQVFKRLSTQWVVGMSGPVGLNYSSLQVVFDYIGVSSDDRLNMFDAIRTMEAEALRQMQRS